MKLLHVQRLLFLTKTLTCCDNSKYCIFCTVLPFPHPHFLFNSSLIITYLFVSLLGTNTPGEPYWLPHPPVSKAAGERVPVQYICPQAGRPCCSWYSPPISTQHGAVPVSWCRATPALTLSITACPLSREQRPQQSYGHAEHLLQPWERGTGTLCFFA